jgi:hypothetical protein|tara:strand:- start:298 stop:1749 length:1452 start_codon:yes stop_codon:yes gene_type:complete
MSVDSDNSGPNDFTENNFKSMMENLKEVTDSMDDMKGLIDNITMDSDVSGNSITDKPFSELKNMMENLQETADSMSDMKDFNENINIDTDNSCNPNNVNPLDNLSKIVYDFTNDLLNTFPELKKTLHPNLMAILEYNDTDALNIIAIKEHCLKIYPERFFDILYKNEKLFSGEEPIFLLPGIDFLFIWTENISDTTRKTIWKYLQLLLFALVSDMSDTTSFGDTAKLFEAIDKDEFKSKLQETIFNMDSGFDSSGNDTAENNIGCDKKDLPDPEKIHDHMNKMLNGKLGNLAREIAEETASDINIDMEDDSSVNDVFQKLFKNPTKLMDLVTNVGSKLDTKIKSGDLKESELLAEAAEMMQHMKDMPGMENIQNLFSKMGSDKMNNSAMQSHLKRNINLAKQKERMRSKISKPVAPLIPEVNSESVEASNQAVKDLLLSEGVNIEDMENVIYSTGETYEKSTRKQNTDSDPKKKRKKKKKQNK